MSTQQLGAEPAGSLDANHIVARLDRVPFSKFHKQLISLVGVGTFFDAYDSLAIASALTVIFVSLNINFSNTGNLIAIAYVGQFIGALVFGWLSEVLGRKWTFIISLLWFGSASLLAAFAWNFQSLFWIRFVQGIGLGGEVPVASAIVNEFVQGKQRGKYVTMYETLFSWGIFATPLLGFAFISLFGPDMGWRVIFGIGIIPALVAILCMFRLPESVRWQVHRGRLAAAEATVTRVEGGYQSAGHILPEPDETLRADVSKTNFGELFSAQYRGRTILAWVQWFMAYFVTYGYTVWLPSLYVRIGHLSATTSLLLTAITGALGVIVSYALALILDSVGRKPAFTGAFAFMVIGAILGFILTNVFHLLDWRVLFAVAVVMLIGSNVNSVGVYTYTPELYPTRMRGWATSAASSMNRIASFIAPLIIGAILQSQGNTGIGWVFLLFAVASAIGLIVMMTMGIETKGRPLEEISA